MMQKDEAIMILSRHLMQCGMLMPIEWVQSNGEGSEFMQAFEMAMDALKNEPVRCKDCRWFDQTGFEEYNAPEEDLSLHVGWCKSWRKDTQACVFCSYGERKGNA